jgi:OmpA family
MKKLSLWLCLAIPLSIWGQNEGFLTQNVYFEYDKAIVTHDNFKTLNALFDSLNTFSTYQIRIQGNTDADGSDAYNKKLSASRIEAVKQFLTAKGISPNAFVENLALGESKPIAENVTDGGKQKNRRVDIHVTYKRKGEESIATLFNQLGNSTQNFNITAGRDTLLMGKKGTLLLIPADAFGDLNGQKVTLKMKESLTMSDFLKDNLTSMSDGKILESGGMLYLEAEANGQQIALKNEISIKIPNEKPLNGMQYFTGQRDVQTQQINWQTASNNVITASKDEKFPMVEYPRPPIYPSTRIDDYKFMLSNIEKDCACQGVALLEKYTYQPPTPSRPKLTVKTPSVSEPKNVGFWQKIGSIFKKEEAPKTMVQQSQQPTPQASVYVPEPEVRYRIATNLSPICKKMAILALEHKVYEENWQLVHRLFRGEYYRKTRTWSVEDMKENLNFAIEHEERELPKKMAAYDKQMEGYKKQLEVYKKLMAERNEAYNRAVANKIASGKAGLGDLTYYAFNTRQLGFINCDRFYNYPSDQIITMPINVRDEPNLDVKLVFKNQKSILTPSHVNGTIQFERIPRDQEVVVVAFKMQHGQPYMAMQDIKTSEYLQNLTFEPISVAMLNEKLKALD